MEELKILQKAFDMMNYAYPALAQYPKGEKFALVVDIKRCMDVMLERIIEANKKYYKKTTLQELDVEVEKLKAYVRLSYNLGFLPPKKYVNKGFRYILCRRAAACDFQWFDIIKIM